MAIKRWQRGIAWALGVVLALAALYGVGRLVHVALGSLYSGERGPYLQMVSPRGVTVRWQTPDEAASVLRYGTAADALDKSTVVEGAREVHAVRLSGLQPATRYYYATGTDAAAPHWFVTAPATGSEVPLRFAVLGDPGYAGPGQSAVRNALLGWLTNHPRAGMAYLDLLLTTGDNAYRSGTNQQFQDNFFLPYREILHNIPVWPTYGNHDARRWAFFDIFSFPAQGESGGVPSGSTHYYAFDYGNAHVVFLDSQASDRGANGAMMQWLKKDLAATTQRWLIAVLHHPPYTRGSHDSDDAGDSGGRMQEMREVFVPVLEQAGADLVLSGHSHMYERSHLLRCHYGESATLDPFTMVPALNRSELDAKAGIYRKQQAALSPLSGTVYLVLGASSKLDDGPLDHPVMLNSLREMGSVVIDIAGNALTARFINDRGAISDQFTIIKGDVAGVAPLEACAQ
ncbi:MAG: metallophosphoesterase family protein [Pseudomonadota bacterium]|nr:MAG: metallophosphoesterase family protein [Pseudomonadota bacterium]